MLHYYVPGRILSLKSAQQPGETGTIIILIFTQDDSGKLQSQAINWLRSGRPHLWNGNDRASMANGCQAAQSLQKNYFSWF